MESLSTLLVMAIVIIVSVLGITAIQRREQAKAKLAEQIAKFRYRANEAARILENFSQIPIGGEARGVLLKFIQLNFSKIQQLSPNDVSVNNALSSINQQLQAPELNIDKTKLSIPQSVEKLNILIKNLSQLAKYLEKFKTIAELNQKVPLAINRISFLILEAKLCAYIQQGKKSLHQHNYVNAQQNFQVAKKMLDKITNKTPRIKQIEKELIELTNQPVEKSIQKDLNIEIPETEVQAASKEPVEESSESDIFGPKKKW